MHRCTLLDDADSKLASVCTASLVYGEQHSTELFGVVPTSSIIVQVWWNETECILSYRVHLCAIISSFPNQTHWSRRKVY